MGEDENTAVSTGMSECLKKTIGGIFTFCGMKVIQHKIFYAVPYVSDEERKKAENQKLKILLIASIIVIIIIVLGLNLFKIS